MGVGLHIKRTPHHTPQNTAHSCTTWFMLGTMATAGTVHQPYCRAPKLSIAQSDISNKACIDQYGSCTSAMCGAIDIEHYAANQIKRLDMPVGASGRCDCSRPGRKNDYGGRGRTHQPCPWQPKKTTMVDEGGHPNPALTRQKRGQEEQTNPRNGCMHAHPSCTLQ